MKWVKRIALGILAIVVVAVAAVYGVSEWQQRRDVGVPLTPIVADTSPAGIAEGKRLVTIYGCLACHADGHGRVFLHIPPVATINAPAFAEIVASESDAVLARSIRQGVSGNGRPLYIMPPHGGLAVEDTQRILGFLRTLRPAPGDLGRHQSFGPVGRVLLVTGKFEGSAHPPLTGPAHRPADSGAYFAETVCLSCHRLTEPNEVRPGDIAPPLAMMAASYDDAAFARLLRTGVGLSKPDLGLMSEVSRLALSRLSDQEITGIHAYLKAKAAAQ